MTAILFGGDYNPEQWPEDVWHEDVRLMRDAGVNTATVGVFSWSSIEPTEGRFTFDWLDRAITLLHENGIGIILATPTASPPPWFSIAHPEALPTTAEGVRLIHGSRDTYNPAAPAYRAAAARITEELAARYGAHPALRGWHLHNEYGTVSFGAEVDARFRDWLERKYGSLGALNRAWHTTFWSQGYASWEQVVAPQATQYLRNPGQLLDFKRFSAALLLECYQDQIDIVRRLSPDAPVTTNFMLPSWLHYDPWAFASASDLVAVDHYVDARGVEGAAHAAFGADLARSFGGGRPWLLMEQAMNLTMRGGRLLAKEPGAGMRTSLQHVARGADGILFFQWRTAPAGAEAFHSTMVPHVGPDSRVFREVRELGQLLGALDGVASPLGSSTPAPVVTTRVAIAWSADAWWAADSPGLPAPDLDFLPAVRRVHRALWMLGRTADFVRLDDDLDRYDLVLVPSHCIASDAEAAALDGFVRGGGHAIVWYFSGTFDDELHVELGGYTGRFAETLGIRVEELHPLEDGESVALDTGTNGARWAETVRLRGAEATVRYADGPTCGEPAITVHRHGDGTARYVSTCLPDDALAALLEASLAEAGIEPDAPEAGDGLEVVRRSGADGTYVVAINHGATARTVTLHGVDAFDGSRVAGPIELAARAFRVLRAQ
ncbi:beta-galactosidase [Curtobacterium ammoniigenes]|uniref:beta-galactosidase n=1 Tax=Curtobacterium ammoniigenes TaxID=395387 RepID=UPI00082DB42C|nr:beta-galactosidase [Curtobacterium ammoniigenes]